MKLIIINGPNLHNIGIRETNIYGKENFNQYFDALASKYQLHEINYFQSHVEGQIVSKIQESNICVDGIILNAGAYSHTSVAIRDAIAAINIPVIMVHLSNVYSRETFRHNNIIASKCKGIITGFGLRSYELAILEFTLLGQ